MLQRAEEIIGKAIAATDGALGHITDLYFDDHQWVVRYFVVDTGNWLSGRLVLIAPEAIRGEASEGESVAVSLTKEQVEGSPSVDTAKPVSRQQEIPYRDYFGWPAYGTGLWGAAGIGMTPGLDTMTEQAVADQKRAIREGDPNLRSVSVVDGYHIHAADGDVGHVEDFIIDTKTWAIRYAVVDTRNWLPGKKVLVSPDSINAVDWFKSLVYVDLTMDRIKNAPEFDDSTPLASEYESSLQEYYDSAAHVI